MYICIAWDLTLGHFLGRNSKKNTLYVCYAFCFICASAPYIRATIAPHQYGVSWKTERSRGRKDFMKNTHYFKWILRSVWGKVILRLRQNIFYRDIFSKGWIATSFVVYFDNIGVHSMHCSIAWKNQIVGKKSKIDLLLLILTSFAPPKCVQHWLGFDTIQSIGIPVVTSILKLSLTCNRCF